jgi:hypothetical protein
MNKFSKQLNRLILNKKLNTEISFTQNSNESFRHINRHNIRRVNKYLDKNDIWKNDL